MKIREYQLDDEQGWVRCRVLSFLETAYYDNVLRSKEKYENPAIELVAVEDGQIVGLIDVEYEMEEGTVCSQGEGLGGMIWHIAIHPDYKGKGIGVKLLKEVEKIALEKGLNRLEAWTRDDEWVNRWYEKNGFNQVGSYLHVYIEGSEMKNPITSHVENLLPVQTFAHYVGVDKQSIKEKYARVHDCFCYVKKLRVK